MKVKFRQTGGYVGAVRACELDTGALRASEAGALRSLVEESGILQASSRLTPGARDLFVYEITVETSERVHHVCFDDLALPASAVPLVEYLRDRARPQPAR